MRELRRSVRTHEQEEKVDNLKKSDKQKIVLFSLEEPRYALPLSEVVKVERAVEITHGPKANQAVSGTINYHGENIPVVDMRKLFRVAQRDIRLEDQLIIARTSQRLVALVVDSVDGVYDVEHHQAIDAGETFTYTEHLSGIASIEHGVVMITDLENFLSLGEKGLPNVALIEGEIQTREPV